jgi:hypothetical protein
MRLSAVFLMVLLVSASPALAGPGIDAVEALKIVDPLDDLQVGQNKITLTHSRTCCPVDVEFCLKCPVQCIKRNRHTVRIVTAGRDVLIRFRLGGKVGVWGG